jgi:hypothetical protein
MHNNPAPTIRMLQFFTRTSKNLIAAVRIILLPKLYSGQSPTQSLAIEILSGILKDFSLSAIGFYPL